MLPGPNALVVCRACLRYLHSTHQEACRQHPPFLHSQSQREARRRGEGPGDPKKQARKCRVFPEVACWLWVCSEVPRVEFILRDNLSVASWSEGPLKAKRQAQVGETLKK